MSIVYHAMTIVNSAMPIHSLGMKEFGKLVQHARDAKGMKSYELADAIGKQRSYMSRLEGGDIKETPPPETVRAICRVLGISMRSLVEALGYLDPEEMEPGIAYEVPAGSVRADLLDALQDAPDEVVRLLTRTAEGSMEILAIARSGHRRASDSRTNSGIDASTNRTA